MDRCTHSYAHSHVVVAHGERLLAYVRKRARDSNRSAVACGPLAAFALPLLYGLQCGMTSTNQARLHAAAVELTCQSWTQKRDGWVRALQSSQEAASASISSSSGPWRPPQTRQTPRALERRRVRRRSANSEAHRLRLMLQRTWQERLWSAEGVVRRFFERRPIQCLTPTLSFSGPLIT